MMLGCVGRAHTLQGIAMVDSVTAVGGGIIAVARAAVIDIVVVLVAVIARVGRARGFH